MLLASGLESGMSFQSVEINGKTLLQRYSPAPSAYNVCACSIAQSCPDPIWSGGQFLCHYGDNCIADTVIWSIPGFIKSCTTLETVLGSDLRCFFNKTCFNILLSMYNTDIPKRLPLSSATLNINVLNSSTMLSFQPNDNFETILGELMIDKWDIFVHYAGYYNSCAPISCTYTYTKKMDIFYMLTVISSYFGGLVIIFRLLAPICVRFVHWILIFRYNNHSNIEDQRFMHRSAGFLQWCNILKANIKRLVTTMNLFKKESSISQMDNAEIIAVKASYVYTILLSITILGIGMFYGLDQVTVIKTIPSPSITTYEELQAKYPNTFSCSCQRFVIFFSQFASITPKIHQICSREFTQASWTTLLYGYNESINNYQRLDRPLLSKHLQILGWLCKEANTVIGAWFDAFYNNLIIDTSLLTRPAFESLTDSKISDFKSLVLVQFQLIIPLISEMLEGNLLPTVFNTDWTIEYGNKSNGYLTRSIPRLYMNKTCNCVVSNLCQDYLRVGPSNLTLPGLVIGCSPIEGLRMSTLECFYSFDCIYSIITYIEYNLEIDGSSPSNFVPPTIPPIIITPLNNSIKSHFLPNTSIGTLINEMFIEEWINTSSYELYFNACAPNQCQYQHSERQDILYVIISLLSVYGIITIGWKFIIWNVIRISQSIKHWYHTHHTIVQPFSITR